MPVDIASGTVHLEYSDSFVPGKVSLTWERLYSTAWLSRAPTPLGHGWCSRYFATLEWDGVAFRFISATGSLETIEDPKNTVENGGIIASLAARLEIFREGPRRIVRQWDSESGEIWRYCFTRSANTWLLTSIEDLTGQGLDLRHDASGTLVSIRQRLEKRLIRLGYDETGRITAVSLVDRSGALHAIANYEYDARGRLVAAFDALGHAARYEYDDEGRIVREVALDGGVTSFRYDGRGRCLRTSGLDRYDEKTLRYLDAIRTTEVIDSYGAITQYRYRADGQVVSIVNPLGGEIATAYDEFGRVVAERTPSGATATYGYDANGNRNRIVTAAGGSLELTYNDSHQVTALIDPNGNEWAREYDDAHRLVRTTDPNGARWEIVYDTAGNPVEVVNPLGARRRQGYVDGSVVETTDWNGHVTQLRSDAFGRIVERREPLGRTFVFTWDRVGNLTRVVLPDGNAVNASYDTGGNLTALVDPRGGTTAFRYGPCRRRYERIDPNGRRTGYAWGTEPGRLDRVTNPKGETYDFEYDFLGHVIGETSFDGRQYEYAYNDDGWCSSVTNGIGEVIRITRDAEGRMLRQELSDGGFATYAYDALGNVIGAANQDIDVLIERDTVGRVVRETQGVNWIRTQRNLAGDRTRTETSLGYVTTYDLDANGDPVLLSTANNRRIRFEWDAGGREILRTLTSHLELHQAYDVAGRLAEQRIEPQGGVAGTTPAGGETLLRRLIARDAAGAPIRIDDSRWGTTEYAYDPAGQLTVALRQLGISEQFDYDETGNLARLTPGEQGEQRGALVYGRGDRLLRSGDTTYEYDSQGRLVSKTEPSPNGASATWRYQWDALDQLRVLTRPDGAEWRYAYDAFGRRIGKRGPERSTVFIWDGDVVVHELSSGERAWTGWVYADATALTPIAQVVGSRMYAVVSDYLGTPREVLDEWGRVVWRFQGRAYGGGVPEIDEIANPFRFQGQYRDAESGLHYNRFRYYDPATARYIQQDPIALIGSDNLYRYAPNPTVWIDPFGLTTASCKSGDRGRAKAVEDLKKAGFKIVGEEVTMIVGKSRIRADFVAEKNGRLYVFEVKNGTGGLTENQKASGAFNIGNPANQNGEIRTSGGSDPPGRVKPFTVDTDNAPPRVGDRGDTGTATFATLKYDGTPGSRVE